MGKQDEIFLKIDNVTFDTAKSSVEMVYDTKDGYLSVSVYSRLSETHQSAKEWMDLTSYGQCLLIIENFETLRELADCIKDEDWLQIHNKEETLFKDESIKRAVLERLYNAGNVLGDFLTEEQKKGSFDDITDSEDRINLWELVLKVERKYLKDHRSNNDFRMLIKDIPNADSRFTIIEPEIETRRLMNGSTYSERPIEKYLITIRRDNAGIFPQDDRSK